MKKKRLALPKHATVKLSVTVKRNLKNKYDPASLTKIKTAN